MPNILITERPSFSTTIPRIDEERRERDANGLIILANPFPNPFIKARYPYVLKIDAITNVTIMEFMFWFREISPEVGNKKIKGKNNRKLIIYTDDNKNTLLVFELSIFKKKSIIPHSAIDPRAKTVPM